MLRITVVPDAVGSSVLRVEGAITAETVELLRLEVANGLEHGALVVLELEGVPFIDSAGIALLQSWPRERIALSGGTGFLRRLLRANGIDAD